MPFLDHLAELRVRLMIVLVTAVLAFALALWMAPWALGWLMKPLISAMESQAPHSHPTVILLSQLDGTVRPVLRLPPSDDFSPITSETLPLARGARLALGLADGSSVDLATPASRSGSVFFLSPIEPIMLILKAAGILGIVMTIPIAAYQAWLFIAPGLLRRERRVLGYTLASMVVLFPLGASFAYLVSRIMLTVLLSFSSVIPGLEPSIVAGKGIAFILTMMVVFGVVFEFPLVLVLLSRLGVVSADFLAKWRRTAIVLMAVSTAFITPPDPFSMLALFIPVLALYELSIMVIRGLDRAGNAQRAPAKA